jgi:hypothetical protein
MEQVGRESRRSHPIGDDQWLRLLHMDAVHGGVEVLCWPNALEVKSEHHRGRGQFRRRSLTQFGVCGRCASAPQRLQDKESALVATQPLLAGSGHWQFEGARGRESCSPMAVRPNSSNDSDRLQGPARPPQHAWCPVVVRCPRMSARRLTTQCSAQNRVLALTGSRGYQSVVGAPRHTRPPRRRSEPLSATGSFPASPKFRYEHAPAITFNPIAMIVCLQITFLPGNIENLSPRMAWTPRPRCFGEVVPLLAVSRCAPQPIHTRPEPCRTHVSLCSCSPGHYRRV